MHMMLMSTQGGRMAMVSALLTLRSGIEWTWPPPTSLLEVNREGSHGVHDHTPLDDIVMANPFFLIGKADIQTSSRN